MCLYIIYICIYIYVHTCIYIYIYISRERERKRAGHGAHTLWEASSASSLPGRACSGLFPRVFRSSAEGFENYRGHSDMRSTQP